MMNKTVKIARPKFPRNTQGPTGRVEHDSRGNAKWVRSRAADASAPPDAAPLSLIDESTVKAPVLGRTLKPKKG